jgi:hypothetical protein
MISFIMGMGPSGPIMLLISVVILVLIVTRGLQALKGMPEQLPRVERGLDAILFWGIFSAVLGLLGQFIGHYKGLTIMIHAEKINPRMVFLGLAECFSSTIVGLTILLISSLAWFTLRSVVRFRQARAT